MRNEEQIRQKTHTAWILLTEVLQLLPEADEEPQLPENEYRNGNLVFPTDYVRRRRAWKERQEQQGSYAADERALPKNKVDTLATSEKENQMKIMIEVPGISINSKPRKDGRYQGYAVRDGEKRYFYGRTYAEVERKIAQFWKEGNAQKKEKQKNSPTFGEYTEKWICLYKAPKLKPSSLESVRSSLKFALQRFSEKRLAAITSDDLQEMLLEMTGGRIRQQCQSNLNQIFRKAFLQGIIKRNPCEAVELQVHRYEKKHALTISEVTVFLAETANSKYSLLYRLVLATGLRIGEALALLRSDVDFVNHTVTVSKNVIFLGGERIEQDCPKTEAANRTLPISESLCAELAEIETDTLFPFSYNSIRLFTARTAKKLKLSVSLHILRHTYATRLEEAGIPPKIKQYLMGHASLHMTQDVYTDTQQEYVESVSEKIRRLFEPDKS